jgi:hypothetical protein
VSPLKSIRRPWLLWSLYALAVLLPPLAVWNGRPVRRGAARATNVSVPADWTLADLLHKLEPLGLRVVPVNLSGDVEDGVFLTTTALGWRELSLLHKVAGPGTKALGRWHGTVSIQSARRPPDTLPLGGDRRSSLYAGRFYFYGDPDLLDQIEAVLGE